ncbi:Breast carcinoma amplified sequence 3 [Terramyces sp. JEL0728]|nr:Breast carcinoma amplified sequence 3 [Terramyces sp. JEL0728]
MLNQKPKKSVKSESEEIICARFAHLDQKLLLLLGYQHGFQIWHVDALGDKVNEMVSIKSNLSKIIAIDLLKDPEVKDDKFALQRPLVMMIESCLDETETVPQYKVHLFSLVTLSFVNTLDFGNVEIEVVKSTKIAICISGPETLQIYSPADFSLLKSFDDLWPSPTAGIPEFDLALRSICYTCTAAVQPQQTQDDQDMFHMDDYKNKTAGEVAGELAVKAAKELVDGVTLVGGMGYNAIQNYFNGDKKDIINAEVERVSEHDGVVMIRKISRNSKDFPVLSLFRPHKHPISQIKFNPAETMIFTASSIGTNIYCWSIMNCFSRVKQPPTCVMKFGRGFTFAVITHLEISNDGHWLSCSTSRGTNHLYHMDNLSNANQTSSVKVNSRNSLQVVKSLFQVENSQETLGSSPVNIRLSSSVDNATSDMGYDDAFVDAYKNIPMTTFIRQCGNKVKSMDPTLQKRIPLLSWDPYGKITLIHVDMYVQPELPSNPSVPAIVTSAITKKMKMSVTKISEWTVCRNPSWQECGVKFIKDDAIAAVKPEAIWPSKIEINTCNLALPYIWSKPLCTLQVFEEEPERDELQLPIAKNIVLKNPVLAPHSILDAKIDITEGMQSAMDSELPPPQGHESFYQTEEGFHLIVSSKSIPSPPSPSLLTGFLDSAKRISTLTTKWKKEKTKVPVQEKPEVVDLNGEDS